MGSALLDSSNKRHWELIQQTEGGTAWLLKHFEDYASALAQNMPQTYLSPFTIVTPNIGEQGPWGWRHVWLGEGCAGDLDVPGDTTKGPAPWLRGCVSAGFCVFWGVRAPGVPGTWGAGDPW